MIRHSEHECGLFLLPARTTTIAVDPTSSASLNILHLSRVLVHAHLSACIHAAFRRKMREPQAYEDENMFKAQLSDMDTNMSMDTDAGTYK